jgi:hypothetical protein
VLTSDDDDDDGDGYANPREGIHQLAAQVEDPN